MTTPCCVCCGRGTPRRRAGELRLQLAALLRRQHPAVEDDDHVCAACLDSLRMLLLSETLLREQEELDTLERQLERRTREFHEREEHVADQFRRTPNRAERLADGVARVGGSWSFVIGFVTAMGAWIGFNARVRAFDPYPFILLNLLLSCLAALQAPIIMMSQNRAAARDRLEADEDFKINVKAALEVSTMHDKLDHLLHAQRRTSMELQHTVLEMLAERR